jgi:uncharacterized protein YegJ (DUF2314 family)
MIRTRFPLFLLISLGLVSACRAKVGETVRRPGQPDMTYVSGEDVAMNQAIQTARGFLPTFRAALADQSSSRSRFAVKVAFAYGTAGGHEHIWLTEPAFAAGRVTGVVSNEPVDVTTLRIGQRITAPEADVSDWMYLESGVLRGGYTLRVLLDRLLPAERAEMLRQMDFRLE